MQRCTELNVTNRSRAYPGRHRKEIQKDEERLRFAWKTTEAFTADVGWRDLKLYVWIRYNRERSEQLYSVLREHKYIRLRGQAVKTSPFHGGNTGSNPVGVIFFNKEHIILIWRRSQVVRHGTLTPWLAGSNPASPVGCKSIRSISSVGRALDF